MNKDLYNFFYEHSDSNQWHIGLENLEDGNHEINLVRNMLSGNVVDFDEKTYRVNIKFNDTMNRIQWLECNCNFHKKNKEYCSHILTTLLYSFKNHTDIYKQFNHKNPAPLPDKYWSRTQIKQTKTRASAVPKLLIDQAKSIAGFKRIDGDKFEVFLNYSIETLDKYILDVDSLYELAESNPNPKLPAISDQVIQLGFLVEEGNKANTKLSKIVFDENSKDIPAEAIKVTPAKVTVGKQTVFTQNTLYRYDPSLIDSTRWLEHKNKTLSEEATVKLFDEDFESYKEIAPVHFGFDTKKFQVFDLKIEKTFDLDKQEFFKVEDSTVSLDDILSSIAKKKSKYLQIKKKWVKLPDYIFELSKSNVHVDTYRKFILFQTISFQNTSKKNHDETLKTLYEGLKQPYELAELKKQKLRSYQQAGLEWMVWLHANSFNGLLADDMGLGKTHQALGFMEQVIARNENPKVLVIVPTSVLHHWASKISEFTDNVTHEIYHGQGRNFHKTLESTVVIASYGIVMRDIKAMEEVNWDLVVFDEIHYLKNKLSMRYKSCKKLRSKMTLGLSGTPMENSTKDLKNIFDLLLPSYLGSDDFFKRNFIDREQNAILKKLIGPFYLRREKKLVLKELPAKTIDSHYCELTPLQKELYNHVLKLKRPSIEEHYESSGQIPYLHIFSIINLLKQICDHPQLFDGKYSWNDNTSGKFELLKDILDQKIKAGEKIVIFSQYIQMIKIIQEYLKSQSIDSISLTGTTRDRQGVIDKFQTDPNCRVFVGSLLAGGIGIDLTSASVVVHFDRWWNASKETQAEDRVHRIGQEKNVYIYRLLSKNTIEEKIDRIIKHKEKTSQEIVSSSKSLFKDMDRTELDEFFRQV